MISKEIFATHNLLNRRINGWIVTEQMTPPYDFVYKGTADYSLYYKVKNDNGDDAIMKVLDLYKCQIHPLVQNQKRSEIIEEAMRNFRYEKKLSEHCNGRKVKRIVSYIESGELELTEFDYPLVNYIIYENYYGVLKDVLDYSKKISQTTRIQSLVGILKMIHDITSGINQLHRIKVTHQDISPSKVQSVKGEFKLGDLSRALCLEPSIGCPFSLDCFNGRDYTYAPPEVLFNYKLDDEQERLYQIDNYMLGAMLVYYITGLSYNVFIERHLPSVSIRDMAYSNMSFEAAKAYLINAHSNALVELKNNLVIPEIKEEIIEIVRYLCYPIPEQRGHPKVIGGNNKTPNYNLERTISKLDLLRKKSEILILKNGFNY